MVHEKGELLHRHMHSEGFFALVLSGSYVEAGDTGRHRVQTGDVILHRPYERHLDRVSMQGAEVLVIPLGDEWPDLVLARLEDPDLIARIAERDMVEARAGLVGALVERRPGFEDWPDLLALDLIEEPDLTLSGWAESHGLHPNSLARGFGQQFGISPDSFRTIVRARRAIEPRGSARASLSEIASEQGFADQAHMSRVIKSVTGYPPNALRRHWRHRTQEEERGGLASHFE